jgi:Fe-S-cluster-containing hydrogenase component 2
MKKVTAALIGAGGRGQYAYAPYALQNPDQLEFVAVAEPRGFLREEFEKTYRIKPEFSFHSWEEMQDTQHVEPALQAIKQGYKHILLEKPIDPNIKESFKLLNAAKANNVNIQVCHGLRYTPYFRKLKELLDHKWIGEIINIVHTEGVGFFHHAHSFVRGDWGDTTVSSPMILAKCCHDMDLMVYLTGKMCKNISSYGALTHFRLENAPLGSTERCTDDCKVKETCPYNAIKIYNQHENFRKLACEKEGFTDLTEALQKGRYGRCVYRCGSNAVDHQTVNILLEDDITVALTMSAFSHRTGRDIRIMGTMGEIIGSMEDSLIKAHHFASSEIEVFEVKHPESGHNGADEIIMRDFVEMVSGGKQGSSDIDISMQSHIMCHLAEKSRLEYTNFAVSI